jgi:endonuclease/exonuclease/phosphatase family metal-dependent hydrolase
MLVQYFHTQNGSKKLILINTHNSAYDKGQLKAMEMQYFKEFIVKKYAEGHYIVVGGDWNQTPPGLACQQAAKNMGINNDSSYCPANIPADLLPNNWQWAYDVQTASNRSLSKLFKAGETPVSLVDYYLVSPNIKVHSVEGHSLKFRHSDHNPVSISLELMRDSSLQKQVNRLNPN